jgi:hypothetical protein
MNLAEYFRNTAGVGVLATTNKEGLVNTAIYARPHVNGDGTLSFIMRNKQSRRNVLENSKASYLFKENSGFTGVRLTLQMLDESDDQEKIRELSKRPKGSDDSDETRYLVRFSLLNGRKLIGDQTIDFT